MPVQRPFINFAVSGEYYSIASLNESSVFIYYMLCVICYIRHNPYLGADSGLVIIEKNMFRVATTVVVAWLLHH